MPSNVLHPTFRCAGAPPVVVENLIAEAKLTVFSHGPELAVHRSGLAAVLADCASPSVCNRRSCGAA